jgi:hypothetical protein
VVRDVAPSDPTQPDELWVRARAVADAVLYEGYLLYPYRKSSGKNRVRWQFGVLLPPPWVQQETTPGVAGSAESWFQQAECLVEAAPRSRLHVLVRFLQPVARQIEERLADGSYSLVDELQVGEQTYVTFEEARPREFLLEASCDELLTLGHERSIELAGDQLVELLGDAGRIVRTTQPVSVLARLSAGVAETPFPLLRFRLQVSNADTSVPPDAPREEALRHSLVATHALLAITEGRFVSLLEPPLWAEKAAKECENLRTFPVLIGRTRELMLASPIILYDYPEVAPESPGDLFDASEIDEILSLRTMTLTDDEKREARATDPRSAEVINRVDAMPPEWFARLHGAIRSLRPVTHAEPSTLFVDGATIREGSRVRLHPRRHGTDAQDLFLDGRSARVAAVMEDVDGETSVAVTLEDDPGAELHEWYGRFRYFTADEVEPLEGP